MSLCGDFFAIRGVMIYRLDTIGFRAMSKWTASPVQRQICMHPCQLVDGNRKNRSGNAMSCLTVAVTTETW